MQPHLVFTLHATIGSMGELCGQAHRSSKRWPMRSAILGLMGAALGLRRQDDFSQLDALKIDMVSFLDGSPMRDFHTAHTVPRRYNKQATTRPNALRAAGHNVNTVLTIRDYYCDLLFGIAVTGDADLHEIANALSHPEFTLYFGRKACPLASPLGAIVVDASTPLDALTSLKLPPWHRLARGQVLYSDDQSGGIVVHDVPTDRSLWHFDQRRVSYQPIDLQVGTI